MYERNLDSDVFIASSAYDTKSPKLGFPSLLSAFPVSCSDGSSTPWPLSLLLLHLSPTHTIRSRERDYLTWVALCICALGKCAILVL